jgi:hypothetical protein
MALPVLCLPSRQPLPPTLLLLPRLRFLLLRCRWQPRLLLLLLLLLWLCSSPHWKPTTLS